MPLDEKVASRAVKQGANANDVSIQVANGATLGAPIFEDRKGKRNWMAILVQNKDVPSLFDRRFLERGKGKSYYVLGSLKVGDPVEFGADFENPDDPEEGRKRVRWYGVVKALTDTELILVKTNGPEEALSFSEGIKAAMEAPANKLVRLKASKQALAEAMKQIDSEIKSLEEIIQKEVEKK